MWFLFYCKYEVAWDHIWDLFRLPFKHDFISIFHSFFNLYIQCLHIINNFASLAMRAVGSIGLSPSTTPITLCLHLHLHSEPHLNFLHDDTLPPALWTLLGLAVFGTRPAALRTIHVPCDRHIPRCAQIELL